MSKLKILINKYNNLKQYPWAHFLCLGSCLFLSGLFCILFYICFFYYGGILDYLIFYDIYAGFAYIIWLGITVILAILNIFTKFKIKNNFLLNNKIYNFVWHTSNILILLYIFYFVYSYIIYIK